MKRANLSDGRHYNLKEILQRMNRDYFQRKVDLPITWFGSANRKARWHRTLGYYDVDRKVIKIHRLLDNPFFPSFYIEYLVYHEMLHHVCPPYYSKNGRYLRHHKAFKAAEKKFSQYQLALDWEKKNLEAFFT